MTSSIDSSVFVCAAADLAEEDVAIADVPEYGRVAVFFTEGEYFGIRDLCSHQQAYLSDGFVEGCAVECPLHSSSFDLRTGEPDAPPASIAVPTFRAWSADGDVYVSAVPRTLETQG